jgi:DNA-binding LacI/PurR family transcriptional regulator
MAISWVPEYGTDAMALTTSRPRTKHEELTRTLRDLAATLGPGDRFPSQAELMRRYHVSDRTVLRSLDDLSRAGWIVRRRGSGTFVAERERCGATPAAPVTSTTIAALALTCTPSRFYQYCLDVLSVLVEQVGWSLVGQHAPDQNSYGEILPLEALRPRGFIAFHYRLQPIARRLIERGHRAVIVGAPPVDRNPDVPCVTGDHEHGGYLAARHLLDLGHRHIGYARLNTGTSLLRTSRWQGYQRALTEAERNGNPVESSLFETERLAAWISEPALAGRFFRRPDAPTGVVAWNDSEADLLLQMCHAAGLRVPEELSIIGYDALPDGSRSSPPLTTVDQHITLQLRYALDLLARSVPPLTTQSILVLPTLVQRASCAPPRRR